MKRIIEYRNLFNADKDTTLSELKKTYRNLVRNGTRINFKKEIQNKEKRSAKVKRSSMLIRSLSVFHRKPMHKTWKNIRKQQLLQVLRIINIKE
jgi:hypothetical protein